MIACPKCHSTAITETTRQVQMFGADFAQALLRSMKFMFAGIIIGAAILAVVVNTVTSVNSHAVGRFLAMSAGLVVFFCLLAMYLRHTGMGTLHVYTCPACRTKWCELARHN